MKQTPRDGNPASDALHERARAIALEARNEDLGAGDITSLLVDGGDRAEFKLVARGPGILAGREIADDVLSVYGDSITLTWGDGIVDGALIGRGEDRLATLIGPSRDVLAAERVLLNFLQRLCGVATLTRTFVDAVAGTGAVILDTRKTTPGWRLLEKYAVRCGGGGNHRMGLHDAILIKDNHLVGIPIHRLAARVFEMLNEAGRLKLSPTFVEVEADTPEQFRELLKVAGIDVILLDNFPIHALREAVACRDSLNLRGKLALEASGGIALDNVRQVAQTGVERISVGAITHSAVALDLALDRV